MSEQTKTVRASEAREHLRPRTSIHHRRTDVLTGAVQHAPGNLAAWTVSGVQFVWDARTDEERAELDRTLGLMIESLEWLRDSIARGEQVTAGFDTDEGIGVEFRWYHG